MSPQVCSFPQNSYRRSSSPTLHRALLSSIPWTPTAATWSFPFVDVDQGNMHIVKVQNVHATAATRPVILEIKAYLNELDTCNIYGATNQVPIHALKEQIASVTGVLSEQQRLICRGKVLKDDQLLSAYHVEDGHTLHLVDPFTHQVKICDFGSAKMLVRGEENISYICSRFYRAPQLIFGAIEYTTSIDIWSAGCILAELLLDSVIASIMSFPDSSTVEKLLLLLKSNNEGL
ncbi:unnamed protein product [Lactuca virosa]|uniref:Ubiquitin-like domain-containing protein n=1 Tax=Lactuca virosa TaxID=75947 RepID=A0AAU9NXD3_9ASTR|nr:unnamed protein product [Lactuca virosa]